MVLVGKDLTLFWPLTSLVWLNHWDQRLWINVQSDMAFNLHSWLQLEFPGVNMYGYKGIGQGQFLPLLRP